MVREIHLLLHLLMMLFMPFERHVLPRGNVTSQPFQFLNLIADSAAELIYQFVTCLQVRTIEVFSGTAGKNLLLKHKKLLHGCALSLATSLFCTAIFMLDCDADFTCSCCSPLSCCFVSCMRASSRPSFVFFSRLT